MHQCPKCRNYYDGGNLPYCPADGSPLIGFGPDDPKWAEAQESVSKMTQRMALESRNLRFRSVIWWVITTVVFLMILVVIVINSWLYFTEPELEPTAGNPPIASATPNASPLPTSGQRVVATTRTSPTPLADQPRIGCEPDKRAAIIDQLRTQAINGKWRSEFEVDRSSIIDELRPVFSDECNRRFPNGIQCRELADEVEAVIADRPRSVDVNVVPDCSGGTITLEYTWTVSNKPLDSKIVNKKKQIPINGYLQR